ncbi:hypothetical protein BC835DRAFT_1413785 [Cytidiella melzeri]|nr:hypothetical protein BC835DRAFT_1413785 [Cytidiella melzeri]
MNYISSYDYYRTQLPAWGSSQFQFRAPPTPPYQPRPTWTGFDYYRAHAPNPDHNLYYTVMNRTRDFGPSGGVGTYEARIWQRRVYSGMVNLTQLLPADIGIAAGYEAYRYWKHHNRLLFEPLAGMIDREREGLVGLAIAEGQVVSGNYRAAPQIHTDYVTVWNPPLSQRLVMDGRTRGYEAPVEYGSASRRRSRRYSTAEASPIVLRADSSANYAGTPYSDPINMHARAGSTGSGGYATGGSPYYPPTTSAMPIPGAGIGAGGAPYGGPGGSPYGMSALPGTGSSPYGGGLVNGMPGAGPGGISVPGGGFGGMGGAGATNAMYGGTTPPMGTGVGFGVAGSTAGMQFTGGAGVSFPGGYQGAGNQAATYGVNPPSPYGGGVSGMPAPAGYAGSQAGFGGASMQYMQQPPETLSYQQQQSPYADGGINGMNGARGGATIVANGRNLQAPAGSTIVIDTKGHKPRSRRLSTSGYETKRSRTGSVEPMRREQVRVGYAR